jgi:hypothetical protein
MNQRTSQQNRAMHKYCAMLSDALDSAGLDIKATLREDFSIPWTPERVKELIWKPVQLAMYDKESTTELDTREVSAVYDVINRHLGEKFGVHVPFPTAEEQ